MTDEQIALARRAVACRGWKWTPGMLASDGFRVCRVDDDGYRFGLSGHGPGYANADSLVPDLTDAATLGCVLALVREAWHDDEMCIVRTHDSWNIRHYLGVETGFWFDGDEWYGRTEAEVLIAALEAAP